MVGCAHEDAFPKTELTGRILLAGQPLPAGWVTLFPLRQTLGDPVILPIQEGTFATQRAPVGPLGIRVQVPTSDLRALAQTNHNLAQHLRRLAGPSSPLRFTTQIGIPNRYQVDLLAPPPPENR